MKTLLNSIFLLSTILLLLAACGSSAPPPLAVADQPTLVYIYTDG